MTNTIKPLLDKIDNIERKDKELDNIGKRKKNIGYDFDGVLHTDVLESILGYRLPTKINAPFSPFKEMINRMKRDHNRGDNIFIITARIVDNGAIKKHLLTNGIDFIPRENIIYTGTGHKIDPLRINRINVFFDDSCGNIRNIKKAKDSGLLPDLERFYYVKPEKRKWYLIDDESFSTYCKN